MGFYYIRLEKKATALPASYNADNLGRATRGAAYAYLGFAYLTRAYEEESNKTDFLKEALNAFNKVEGYELEKNFSSMFDGSNKNCKESVFELQTSMSTANGASYRTQLHRWIGVEELWGGWDEILPSNKLMETYFKEGGRLQQPVAMIRVYMKQFSFNVTITMMEPVVSMAITTTTGSAIAMEMHITARLSENSCLLIWTLFQKADVQSTFLSCAIPTYCL